MAIQPISFKKLIGNTIWCFYVCAKCCNPQKIKTLLTYLLTYSNKLLACCESFFVISWFFFSKLTFFKQIHSGILSVSKTVWIQIRIDVLSSLIWVQNYLQQLLPEDTSRQRVNIPFTSLTESACTSMQPDRIFFIVQISAEKEVTVPEAYLHVRKYACAYNLVLQV